MSDAESLGAQIGERIKAGPSLGFEQVDGSLVSSVQYWTPDGWRFAETRIEWPPIFPRLAKAEYWYRQYRSRVPQAWNVIRWGRTHPMEYEKQIHRRGIR